MRGGSRPLFGQCLKERRVFYGFPYHLPNKIYSASMTIALAQQRMWDYNESNYCIKVVIGKFTNFVEDVLIDLFMVLLKTFKPLPP